MKDWKTTLLKRAATLRDAIETIDTSALQIALVVDDTQKLLGTVTDGDIRRGILRGVALDRPVTDVMNDQPLVARPDEPREALLANMQSRQVRRVPIVSASGQAIGIELLEDLIQPQDRDNWVVLMAGGLGSRLQPLTNDCPKPMLKVGNKPLLETIVENFMEYGFRKFFVSVNYKAEMIKSYFGDGARWNVDIRYLEENERLGTAGALSLLPQRPSAPLIVMNGDVLTKVNFRHLLDFHASHHSRATMCVREYDFQVPYGVVRMDNYRITHIDEKPVQRFFVNAGIYVLEPEVLDAIPPRTFFDMPSLFDRLIAERRETIVFPIREYWLDIGQLADYDRANGEFMRVFS